MSRAFVTFCLLCLCGCPPQTWRHTRRGPAVTVTAIPAADEALAKAVALLDAGRKADARIALQEVRQRYPTSTAGQEALFRLGTDAFDEGRYPEAKKTLDELVYENPLYVKASEARLKSGLAAVQLRAFSDAKATLEPLLSSLEGADKQMAEEGLAAAEAGLGQSGAALKLAIARVDAANGDGERQAALTALERVVDSDAPFTSLAEQWMPMSPSHPAWPLLSLKMARIYFHLRDWQRLDETLKRLMAEAPTSAAAAEAKAMQARVAKRSVVRPRVLGAILPLSGKLKPVGEAVRRALTMALAGSDVELVLKDSGNDPSASAKLVEQLALDDGVIGIIGPLGADDSKRAALVADELQVPLLSLSRAEDLTRPNSYVFRTMVTNSQQAEALVDYAMGQLGMKNFAVLYPNIGFGTEMSNAFWDAVERRGGQVRGAESYEHDQTTFTSEAKKLVGRYYLEDRGDYYKQLAEAREGVKDERLRRKALEKARDAVEPIVDFEALLIPDTWSKVALVAPALAVEDVVTNACDRRDIDRIAKTTGKKLKTVLLLGPATWASPKGPSGDPQLVERGGKYVLCSVYVDGFYEGSDRPQTKAFVQAFREANRDTAITLVDAVAYDTGRLLRDVLDRQGPKTRPALRDSLLQLKGFEGATGTLRFDENGEVKRDLFLLNLTSHGIKELPHKKSSAPANPPEG